MRARILAVAAALLVVVPAAGAAPSPRPATIVGVDPAADWGSNATVGKVGDSLGQDLIRASVASAGSNLRFELKLAHLPDFDPTVSAVYSWGFKLRGHRRVLISCGNFVQDCSARQNFHLMGDCVLYEGRPETPADDEFDCERLGELPATYSAATSAITLSIPLKTMRARPGDTLVMKNEYIQASPQVVFATEVTDVDQMKMHRNFTIPTR